MAKPVSQGTSWVAQSRGRWLEWTLGEGRSKWTECHDLCSPGKRKMQGRTHTQTHIHAHTHMQVPTYMHAHAPSSGWRKSLETSGLRTCLHCTCSLSHLGACPSCYRGGGVIPGHRPGPHGSILRSSPGSFSQNPKPSICSELSLADAPAGDLGRRKQELPRGGRCVLPVCALRGAF